ncbi:hypothetical protein A1O3_09663 [Capronia epimyces CBS 606.96]|uniref:Luciferase-like domain-containing protein n=1 Tax=Capronia epimyces CBS 606.96 TaxID=1182542 RepID=W9XAD9_9EURO|nr:uncharacterized protein A1O3_09663 [Capronia epimyces CBS 606.96]EXJ77437.1 hypothetical protein A1O3_09663 [Capronia epimyces CBS 606.96]
MATAKDAGNAPRLANGPKKRILLNAFDMNGVGHISVGQWTNPDDKSLTKSSLEYWIHVAKVLESGKINALFLADNFGSHDVYRGSHATAIKAGCQWPLYDPFVIISAMAAVTTNLNFGITACTTFEPPFILAKRFSTLDHITKGRVAWNIVTSWSETAAQAMGLESLPEHDERYAMADEYVELMYKLWEGSWADDAVIADRETGVYADPDKVRKINHSGKYFQCKSAHQVNPSPQRTPVLFQAGMSPAGAQFGAKHAECIFVSSKSPTLLAGNIKKTRALAAQMGRDPQSIKFFVSFTPILGATEEEAQAKFETFRRHSNPEGALALYGGIARIDLSTFPLDEELPTTVEDPALAHFSLKQREVIVQRPDGINHWTPRIMSEWLSIGGNASYVVGTGDQAAQAMERWILEADVDGFNLSHVVVPQAWEDIVTYLIPALEKRGWLGDNEYPVPGGTARENLYGTPGNARLRPEHPGSRFKFEVCPES